MKNINGNSFWRSSIQPLLIAIFSAFFLFSINVGETCFSEFVTIVLVTTFSVLLLLKITYFFFRDYAKASIFLSAFLIFFFFLSPLLEYIKENYGGQSFFRARYFLILCFIFICWIFIKLKKSINKDKIVFLSKFLVFPFLFLIGFSIVKIGIGKYKIHNLVNEFQKENNVFWDEYLADIKQDPSDKELPNIYFIILDCYASHDVMLNVYGYDNSEFLDKLKKRGFYIAEKCYSNYPSTFVSIPATLNMNYLNNDQWKDDGSIVIGLTNYMVKNNNAARFLKEKGYQYLLNPSHWGPTQTSPYSDFKLGSGLTEVFYRGLIRSTYVASFTSVFLDNTLLAPLYRRFQDYVIRKIVLRQFDMLKNTVNLKDPFFVFTHFVCPHGPYLFNEDGSPSKKRWYEEGIPTQAAFISKKIYEVIDYILEKSSKPPVIIIQADHALGSADLNTAGILNAYYLPDKKLKKLLYPIISPINNFRLILDYYLGSKLGLLKDDYFVWDQFKGFTKITS